MGVPPPSSVKAFILGALISRFMPLDITKQVELDHSTALGKLKEELKARKWGVLADIDVKSLLKEKIGEEIEKYNILDVCNPKLANEGLRATKTAGLVLPCKMAVYVENGSTKVGLYLPTRQLPEELKNDHPELRKLSEEAEASLKQVLETI